MQNEFQFILHDDNAFEKANLLNAIKSANEEALASPESHQLRMSRTTIAFTNTVAGTSPSFASTVETHRDPFDLLRQFEISLLLSRS